MIADSPRSHVSWTTPTIQEKQALGEGEVTRIIGGKRATELHCCKAIIKRGCCIENVLALIYGRWSILIDIPVVCEYVRERKLKRGRER